MGVRRMLSAIAIGAAALTVAGAARSRLIEQATPPLGQFVAVADERLHVMDIGPRNGDLPPVVLIHGASVNLLDMKLALGDALAENRRVVLIDRPGRGYSTRPRDGWRLDVQARLIRDAVEALGVVDPIVIGQSFGGAVALSYGLQFQHELSGLVLLAPVSHAWEGGVAWYNELSGWPVAGHALRRLVLPIYGPVRARRGLPDSFAPNQPPENYFAQSGTALLFRPKDFANHADDLRFLKRQISELQTQYGTLNIPTLIFAGEDDETVSPDIHARRLADDVGHAELRILPDIGHTLHHDAKVEIIRAVNGLS